MAKTKKLQANDIKQDLLDQLDRNGTVGNYYLDLVEKYMNLWETNRLLQKDIDERGVSVKYQNGENQWGYKKNDSVDQQIKVNQQMLKILEYLGIKPSKQDGDVNDGDLEM